MTSGLDSLGTHRSAVGGTGLSGQTIAIRILDVDADKLKEMLGGLGGSAAAFAVSLVNKAPKAALDAAKPIITSQAKNYGVTLDMSISNRPGEAPRALSEFWPGLAVGGVVGFSIFGIVKLVGRLLGR